MKSLFFFLITIFLFTSCGSKDSNVATTKAISTAESVRDKWLKACKPLEFQLDIFPEEHLSLINKVGIYSVSHDATADEKLLLDGVPFIFSEERLFKPEAGAIITGDTTATFYVCHPFVTGLTLKDTLIKKAPYSELLYGRELSRNLSVNFLVRMKLMSGTSLLRFRIESTDITDKLTQLSVSGDHIFTQGNYQPYTGEWFSLEGNNKPIRFDFDRLMNNYQFVNVFLPPFEESSDISIGVRMNGADYVTKTVLPHLRRGSMTQLNLLLSGGKLSIVSSWLEENRLLLEPKSLMVDSVQIGHYLQRDGTISTQLDSLSVGVVFQTDGRHGKAVALVDVKGNKVFSSKQLTSGKIFKTIDGNKKEGFINPSQSAGVDEAYRLVYKPSIPYAPDCVLGYADGYHLSSNLLRKQEGRGEEEDMLYVLSSEKGAYIPSAKEMVELFCQVQGLGEELFVASGFVVPDGEYLTSSESSAENFYMFDFTRGILTGSFPKQFARMKLRLFYLF